MKYGEKTFPPQEGYEAIALITELLHLQTPPSKFLTPFIANVRRQRASST